MRPSGGYLLVVVEDLEQTPEGRAIRDRHDTGPMATDREINCPSAGKSVSAYRETDMSASTGSLSPPSIRTMSGVQPTASCSCWVIQSLMLVARYLTRPPTLKLVGPIPRLRQLASVPAE